MDQPQLLRDIKLRLVDSRALSIYTFEESSRRIRSGGRAVSLRDLDTVSDRANLAQAITLRLLTPRGELAPLGHPAYGCRLHELIGFPNTANTRDLAKLYVIEALKREPRIDTIVRVDVSAHPGDRHRIDIAIEVLPIGTVDVLVIGPIILDLT
jgi:phage baseplate assembly protein W